MKCDERSVNKKKCTKNKIKKIKWQIMTKLNERREFMDKIHWIHQQGATLRHERRAYDVIEISVLANVLAAAAPPPPTTTTSATSAAPAAPTAATPAASPSS